MPTIVDALLISMGLDGSGVAAGAAKVQKDLKNVGASGDATAKDVLAASKKMVEGLNRVRNEVLALVGAFTAGRGLKQLATDIIGGDAALGRLARNAGVATKELAILEQAATRVGGTAEATGASVAGLSAKFTEFNQTGQGGESWIRPLQQMGITLRDNAGRMKSFTQLFLEFGNYAEHHTPQQSQYWLSQLGLDQGTINLIQQGRAGQQRLYRDVEADGVADDTSAKNSQDLLAKIAALRQSIEGFLRAFLNEFIGPITKTLGDLATWITVHGPAIRTEIHDFAVAADGAAQSVGGWVKISEALFALWSVGRVAKLVSGIAGIGGRMNPYVIAAEVALGAGAAAGAMNVPMVDETGRVVGNWGGAEGERNAQAAANARQPLPESERGPGAFFRHLFGSDRREQDDFIARWAQAVGHFFGDDAARNLNPSNWGQSAGNGIAAQVAGLAPGGPSIPLKSGQEAQNAATLQRVFTDAGITPEYAAAFTGNGRIESGLNPAASNASGHVGIFQWDATRRAAIEGHFGKPITSMTAEEQAKAAVWELQTQKRFADLYARARSGHELAPANEAVARYYEAPAKYGTPEYYKEVNNRLRASQGVYGQAPNGVPTTGPAFGLPQHVSALRWGNSTTNSSTDNSTSTHVGTINVQTAATDGPGVGRALKHYLASNFTVDTRRGLA